MGAASQGVFTGMRLRERARARVFSLLLQAVAAVVAAAEQRNAPALPVDYGSLTGMHEVRCSDVARLICSGRELRCRQSSSCHSMQWKN